MIGHWILGENLSTRPEPENEIDKYTVGVTKDARVIDHLRKRRLVDTLKMFFTSYDLIQ